MKRLLRSKVDWVLTLSFLGLLMIGFAVLYSATYQSGADIYFSSYFIKQIVWACAGIFLIIILNFVNYRTIGNLTIIIYAVNVFLLIYVLIFGNTIGGAKRWIDLGAFSLQPSEFMKLTLLLMLSWYLSVVKNDEKDSKVLMTVLILTGIPLLLILKEPDLGTALVLVPMMFTLLFIYGMRLRYLIGMIVLGLCTSPVFWMFLMPYQKSRILVFLNPAHYRYGAGWSVIQSKIAIGSGQLTGKGWLSGTQTQLNFLPEHHTDLIFSVLAEEMGFVGCLILLACYMVFLMRGIQISQWARDDFGKYMACGIVTMIAFHVVVNISMAMGLAPVTGLPLPFMSYGGSFLLMMILSVGFLFNIYAHGTKYLY